MKFNTLKNIIYLLTGTVLLYIIVDFAFRYNREHFGIETKPVIASNDRKYYNKDDEFASENEKLLYDQRQHVLANDFKKYFYFSEIDIPNRIMKDALKKIERRFGERNTSYLQYEWRDIAHRDVSKSVIKSMVNQIVEYINKELPKDNLDTYYKPDMTAPAETQATTPDPTPNPSAIAETRPPTPPPTTTPAPTIATRPTRSIQYSDTNDPRVKAQMEKIRKGRGRFVKGVGIVDKDEIPIQVKQGDKSDDIVNTDSFTGQRVEHYYDYDSANTYVEYYKLHKFKIVNVQRYNDMFRWSINIYIFRPQKSTEFVISLNALGKDSNFKIQGLNLISRKSVDEDFLDIGYDSEMDNYKYLQVDPNKICEMPAIFNERDSKSYNPNCNKIPYNSVSRNRIPQRVISETEREIRDILETRQANYKGFFRPVRFSFGEQALVNRKKNDNTIEKTNQRFLDRL